MSVAPEPAGEGGTSTVASQMAGYLRGGGIVVPVVTALLAFAVGGIVVLLSGATRSRPTRRLQRHGAQLAVPVDHRPTTA